MDAFTHNIECFLSNAFNPPADSIALDGLEKAWNNVERATRDGQDREARYNMAMAAMDGAMGLAQGEVEKIADGAMGDHCHLSTPRQPTKAQYVELIEQSWG